MCIFFHRWKWSEPKLRKVKIDYPLFGTSDGWQTVLTQSRTCTKCGKFEIQVIED
jgi:hypothetical protein